MPLKVCSFNVRCRTADDGADSWLFRRGLAARVLAEIQADVVGLQEAYEDQKRFLLESLPAYRAYGVGRDDAVFEGEQSAILVRGDIEILERGSFWFAPDPDQVGAVAWGARIPRICSWVRLGMGDQSFSVHNLHLDHESQEAREKSVEVLSDRMGSGPRILMGDFNADEENPAIQALGGLGLSSAFRAVHPKLPEPGTYHGFQPEPEPGMIDHIYVSDHWRTVGFEVVRTRFDGRWPSDHFPIVADLELR